MFDITILYRAVLSKDRAFKITFPHESIVEDFLILEKDVLEWVVSF